MMPGMRGMNPRQVKQAMRKLGIKTEDIDDVVEVVIRTKTKQYIIKEPAVSIMEMQGQKTFQVVGESTEMPLQAGMEKPQPSAPAEAKLPEEDILLVMGQTGAPREKAIAALKACDGQPAEAIIKIVSS
jgi:nascent polypeptide-associated complex subunit alpha